MAGGVHLTAGDPVLMHVGNARRAAKRYGVAAADIMGILSVEGGTSSSGRPVAPRDGAGPASYGQFTYGTGASLGVKYGDSASETDAVARYLVQLGYKDDRTRAIAAYNGGPGNPQYDYAAKVENAAKRYAGAGTTTGGAAAPDEPATPATSSSSGGGLIDEGKRSDALKALTWVGLAAGGTALIGLGLTRTVGLKAAA